MAAFEWRDEFSVGDRTIDQQHRAIIDILNELHALLNDSGGKAGGAQHVFDRLADYVTTHFAYEESLMTEAGFPAEEVAAHKRLHNQMLHQVQAIMEAYEGGNEGALKELLPYLYGDWLIKHICESDQEYAPYLKPADVE